MASGRRRRDRGYANDVSITSFTTTGPEGSSVLARLAPALVRHRRLVLVLAVLTLVVAGAYGGGVASSLTGGGFDDPASPSSRAATTIEATFQQGQPDL